MLLGWASGSWWFFWVEGGESHKMTVPAVGIDEIDLASNLDFTQFGTAIGAVLAVAVPVGLLLLAVSQGWGWGKRFAKTK